MVKFNFELVEQTLGKAIHYSFVRKLVLGEPVAYPRAVSFFGVATPKPDFQDSVILALADWQEEVQEKVEEERQKEGQEELLKAEEQDQKASIKSKDKLSTKAPSIAATTGVEYASLTQTVQNLNFNIPDVPVVPPLYILRKRLLWFIKHRIANIYKLLGTTKEEIVELRKKRTRTQADDARIQELLDKSSEINQRLMKKLGLDTDEALIEKEKARHIRKRFNIKETWVPL